MINNKQKGFIQPQFFRNVKTSNGFTILEILIVIGLVGFAAALGLVISLDSYRAYNFQSEKSLILGILQKARSQSLNNINQTSHGVYLQTSKYILFEGLDYLHRNTSQDLVFPGNASLTISGSNEAVFSPLAATATVASMILNDGANSPAIIDINYEGSIDIH